MPSFLWGDIPMANNSIQRELCNVICNASLSTLRLALCMKEQCCICMTMCWMNAGGVLPMTLSEHMWTVQDGQSYWLGRGAGHLEQMSIVQKKFPLQICHTGLNNSHFA